MSILVEEWRPIKDYEGLYDVSDWGRVKRVGKEKIMAQNMDIGYLRVHLFKNGKAKHHLVHRLVAEAFIPNPENKPCVGHLKKLPNGLEDKTANEVWNIAWMTYEENNNYGTINERRSVCQKGRKFTEEHRKNLSESLKNSERFQKTVRSNEYREKLSNMRKGKQLNRPDLSQPVSQYTLDGVFVSSFLSAKDAARQTGIPQTNISRCCNGGFLWKGKWFNVSQAKGFIWKKGVGQP